MNGAPLRILRQTALSQLLILSKSWPARLTDLLMPSLVAFVPLILGRSVAGAEAGANFAQIARTPDFAGFLLIGGGTFLLVTRAFWGFGHWLRQEMREGTLEALYLTPAPMPAVLAGVGLAFILYSAAILIGAMLVGAFLFRIVFRTDQLILAFLFLGMGLPPLYGLALLYGALVLRLKETDAFIQIAQWLTTLLAGVYFPIALFPLPLRLLSLLFPPTWLTQGLRSALLDVPYFFNNGWLDLGVLFLFSLVMPVLGYWAFSGVEKSLKHGSGLGEF
jgi:ABC-2 type transport system permease protein